MADIIGGSILNTSYKNRGLSAGELREEKLLRETQNILSAREREILFALKYDIGGYNYSQLVLHNNDSVISELSLDELSEVVKAVEFTGGALSDASNGHNEETDKEARVKTLIFQAINKLREKLDDGQGDAELDANLTISSESISDRRQRISAVEILNDDSDNYTRYMEKRAFNLMENDAFLSREEAILELTKLDVIQKRAGEKELYIERKKKIINRINKVVKRQSGIELINAEEADGIKVHDILLRITLPKTDERGREYLPLPTANTVRIRLYRKLCDLIEEAPGAVDYIKRIVYRYADDEVKRAEAENFAKFKKTEGESESVSGLILRQFINSGLLVKDTGKKILEYMDSVGSEAAIEEMLIHPSAVGIADSNVTEKRNKANPNYIYIVTAAQLGHGDFGANGIARENIYKFAIAFGMNIHSEYGLDLAELEKLLFFDYSRKDYLSDKGLNESMGITGHGINYKNFAEIIWLYYLNRLKPIWEAEEDNEGCLGAKGEYITRAEGIKKATECTAKIKKMIISDDSVDKSSAERFDNEYTEHYKNVFVEKILNCSESNLEDMIKENFVIPPNKNLNVFQYNSFNNTACKEYAAVLQKIKKYSTQPLQYFRINYKSLRNLLKRNGESLVAKNVLEGINRMIADINGAIERLIGNLECSENPDGNIERVDIIAAYYLLIALKAETELLSYSQVRMKFCNEVNKALTRASMMEISDKNPVDIFFIAQLFDKAHW